MPKKEIKKQIKTVVINNTKIVTVVPTRIKNMSRTISREKAILLCLGTKYNIFK